MGCWCARSAASRPPRIPYDARQKDALTGAGIYPTPIGTGGMAAVDVRDIAAAAAIVLTGTGHAGKTYNLVADQLTGPSAAETWSQALGKPVRYPGPDFDAWEKQMAAFRGNLETP